MVFSTGMTGYVETLTDPSFAGQILVFTYPLIGNYGVPARKMLASKLSSNWESERVWARGVILANEPSEPSHYQSSVSFTEWLTDQDVPGICGVDTRQLTQLIRDEGVLNGMISDVILTSGARLESDVRFLASQGDVLNRKMVESASTKTEIRYESDHPNGKTVGLLDCGVKHGIIRSLLEVGFKVIRLPWNADPTQVGPIDGVVCSNGPGDPKDCPQTVANIRKVLGKRIPVLGICLGHQLLSLAIGADTYKLPYGHRGLNQPVKDLVDNKAYLTSQNHGYAVSVGFLPKSFSPWFTNLNDQTNEGIISAKNHAWGVQFHPEGCPGPDDTKWIFEMFREKIV